MEKRNILIIIAIIGVVIVSIMNITLTDDTLPLPPPNINRVSVIASNLEVPWAIDIYNGTIYFTERRGNVKIIENNQTKVIFSKGIAAIEEGGMLGLALDPEFNINNYIYVYYTYVEEGRLWNKVVRLEREGSTYKESLVLIDKIPGSNIHNGGRIKFGPDNKLYITTGDANEPSLAQDLNSLAGKVLRINKDGSIPDDNPFNSAIYSYGHRNSQGLAWYQGNLYITEHGPVGFDEVNLIRKGANYGWPEEQCGIKYTKRYSNALYCYDIGIAPAGADFHNNNMYIATLRGKSVEQLSIRDGIIDRTEFLSGFGRIRDIKIVDGYMYIATSNRDGRGDPRSDDDKILRIRLE